MCRLCVLMLYDTDLIEIRMQALRMSLATLDLNSCQQTGHAARDTATCAQDGTPTYLACLRLKLCFFGRHLSLHPLNLPLLTSNIRNQSVTHLFLALS